MRLWWDLVDGGDGYGYPWGRSLGVVSYMDTLEIVAFLAQHPEFRPAPLADLVSQYARAWNYLRHDFKDDRHLLSLFDFGRGNFAYITIDREWQQTTGFLGKVQMANAGLAPVLEREKLTAYPARPVAAERARASSSSASRATASPACGSCGRAPSMRFALPITTGTRPGVADYLPAPHGLPGFAVPVEQNVPALVPYLELEDGRTIVAGDGADEIHPSADGRELRAVWRRWAPIGAKSGQLVDPGLTSEVRWTLGDSDADARGNADRARADDDPHAGASSCRRRATSATTQRDGTRMTGSGAPLRVVVDAPWKIDSADARDRQRTARSRRSWIHSAASGI